MLSVVADTNLFVATGFNPESDSAHILGAVQAGTLRLASPEHTRRRAPRPRRQGWATCDPDAG
jgi:hypothetical protein